MELECRFCKAKLSEKEVKEDLYCHCCGALTYQGICNQIAKNLRKAGWALATETNIIAVISDITREYEQMEKRLNNIKKELI